jgi:diaminopimelate epimerase
MTGPAVAVFDGVLNPELLPESGQELQSQTPQPKEQPTSGAAAVPDNNNLDCANDCKDTCQQQDHCLRDEAQARVQEFLSSTSLDAMINLAGDSLEERTLSRFNRDDRP